MVINEVFVPKELRGMRYGEELITGLVKEARARGKENCILFSDYRGRQNLYDRLGFDQIMKFWELSF
jgi:predicted N-acetyltransferase YhbS